MPGESIRERLSALSRAEIWGLVAVLVVTLGGAGLWYVRSLPRPVQVRAARPTGATAGPSGAAASPGRRSSWWTWPGGSAAPACTSSPRAPA